MRALRSLKTKQEILDYYRFTLKCSASDLCVVRGLLGKGLLPLVDGSELAVLFGLSKNAVRDALVHPERHYRCFTISKKNGGRRRICASDEFLAGLQRKIHDHILHKLPVHCAAC